MVVVYFSVIWAERHAWQTLESSFSMYYLVQKLETVMFERQHQYTSLFGTFKADQRKVCELQCNNDLAPPPSCLPSCLLDVKKDLKILCWALPPHVYPYIYLMSCTWFLLPGLPPLFLHAASDQKLEAGTAWEWGYTGLWTGLWTKIWSDVKFHVDYFLVRISLPRRILKPAQTLFKCYLLLVVVASWWHLVIWVQESWLNKKLCISMWSIIFWCFPLHESRCKPLTLNATILTDLWGLSCIDFCELNWAIPNR